MAIPRAAIAWRAPAALVARTATATTLAGLLAGAGAIGFHFLADRFGEFLFSEAASLMRGAGLSWLPAALLVPAVGLTLIGILLHWLPAARVGGVREVVAALGPHGGGMVPLERAWNVVASGLVLAAGGSVGPEGPMVQWGALAGSLAGRGLGERGARLVLMVQAGAAAGIAAAFRSPAGGVLLAVELLGARFNPQLVPVALAATIAYLGRVTLLGDAYPFRPVAELLPLPLPTLVAVVPLMGLVGAFVGHLFIDLFERLRDFLPKGWPLWLRVGSGGVLVGLMGTVFPEVLSAGYSTIGSALRGGLAWDRLAILLVAKMLATSITFGSGAVGGLFAPTLVMGALYGGAVGYGLAQVAPAWAPQPEVFVLIGMVVLFGSIVKGYWSGLLMVADLSGAYHALLLPALLAGGMSYLAGWALRDRSIFGLNVEGAPAAAAAAGNVPEPARLTMLLDYPSPISSAKETTR